MYSWCTVGVQLVYSWCTVGVQLVYSWCIVGVQLVYSCGHQQLHVGAVKGILGDLKGIFSVPNYNKKDYLITLNSL